MNIRRSLGRALIGAVLRVALAVAVGAALFQAPARAAGRLCLAEVSSVDSIIAEMETKQSDATGRVVFDVHSSDNGRVAVLTVVFERVPLAHVYTFLDNCLISATNRVPAAMIVAVLSRGWSRGFFEPTDKGL